MNEKARTLFKNLNYTVSANFLILGVSIILNLIVPKFIGIAEYGYWQLYVFYSSYVGFFHFGWIDGIYLKIGGKYYDDLDKSSLKGQLYYLFCMELVIAIFLVLYSMYFVIDYNKKIIFISTAILLVVSNVKNFVLFIFQATNMIKEYAQLSNNDRYIYLIGALTYLLLGGKNFYVLIFLDIITKIIITIWGLILIADVIQSPIVKNKYLFREIFDNLRIGSKLMLGNIASMLILGITQFFVEQKWSIETFGKLSFALSISNMFMLFINSVSIVLYPLLRRTDESKLKQLYINVRSIFVPFTFFLLLLFFPIKSVLVWWLPEYKESLYFMGILFPMIVYEGRVTMLVNTYLKTIRQEKIILLCNLITLSITIFLTLYAVFVLKNIHIVVLFMIFILMFRCILSEELLSKKINIHLGKLNILEMFLSLSFILSNIFLRTSQAFVLYVVIFIIYILFSKIKIKESINYFIIQFKQKNE